MKQRRKYEEAVVLASQTRCKLFLFLFLYSFSGRNVLPFFLVKCICTPYIIAVNVIEIETLYKLFMKLSSSIVSDGVISKVSFSTTTPRTNSYTDVWSCRLDYFIICRCNKVDMKLADFVQITLVFFFFLQLNYMDSFSYVSIYSELTSEFAGRVSAWIV